MARKVWVHITAGLLGLAALGFGIAQLMGIWSGHAGYMAVVMAFIGGANLGVGLFGRGRSSRWATALLRRGRVGWVASAVAGGLSYVMTVLQHLWPFAVGTFWITASSVVLALVSEPEEEWRHPPRPADKAR